MNYYKKFRIVIGTPPWRLYLRWAYKTCIDDFKKLNFKPDFRKKGFTALLCGVGNEVTAEEFIKFILERNPDPNIWIIDLGKEQINAVKRMVANKFPKLHIKVKQIDALELETLIKTGTVDCIETDGLFEFFDNESLRKLLTIWKRLLTKDGFATTRATSTNGAGDRFLDWLKIRIGQIWMGITVFTHTRMQMHENFKAAGFKFTEGLTPIPYFKRYSMIL